MISNLIIVNEITHLASVSAISNPFSIRTRHSGFAFFFLLQNLPRGMLLSVVPLQALHLMENTKDTSTLLFMVAIGGIIAALGQPLIIKRIGVYRAFLVSCAAMILSAVLMSFDQVYLFSIGLFSHTFAIAAAEVTLTLLVLARIPRSELTSFEPVRILATVLALTIGPFLGVYLGQVILHELPFIISAVSMLISLIYFHRLGLQRLEIRTSTNTSVNPVKHLLRYFKQSRLRLAYGLVMARSCWWTMFIIYTPIYASQTGLGELFGAAIVSFGTAWTLSVPLWGWVARQYGVRRLLTVAFIVTGSLCFSVFFLAEMPVVASVLLVFTALGTTMLDGVGNVLFFRAVRPFELSEMSAVFVTYRDTGQILTPGLFAILLSYFALPVVFLTAGVWMFSAAWFCRFVPKRLR